MPPTRKLLRNAAESHCLKERESPPGGEGSAVAKSVRFDIVIAVCALLISTLATGASWWQARIFEKQTKVLEAQLGAQVWPYVGVSEGIDGNTIKISVANDGLGPAVLHRMSATVDGVPQSSFTGIMHAILGKHLVARLGPGEKLSRALSGVSPGSVLRPADATTTFTLTSKRYARPFLRALGRIRFRTCYCAIIPGKCWQSDSQSTQDPQPVPICDDMPGDLLHANVVNELLDRNF